VRTPVRAPASTRRVLSRMPSTTIPPQLVPIIVLVALAAGAVLVPGASAVDRSEPAEVGAAPDAVTLADGQRALEAAQAAVTVAEAGVEATADRDNYAQEANLQQRRDEQAAAERELALATAERDAAVASVAVSTADVATEAAQAAVTVAEAGVEATADRDNYAQEANLQQRRDEHAALEAELAKATADQQAADARLEVATAEAALAVATAEVDEATEGVEETADRDNHAQEAHLAAAEEDEAAAAARLAAAQQAAAGPAGKATADALAVDPPVTGAVQGPAEAAPAQAGDGVPHQLYPQLVLPPEYAVYAGSQRVTDVRLANENAEVAGDFLGTAIPAAATGARGGPKGALVTGFIGGSIGGVISGVSYRMSHDPVYAMGLPGDEDNMGTTIVCTVSRDAPAGTPMTCRPYSATTAIPFKSWEDRARAVLAGNGDPATSTPQFTGTPVAGQPADYLAPEGWADATASDPWLRDTVARAVGNCLTSGGIPALGNLTRLRGLPVVPSPKEAAMFCGGGAVSEAVKASQQNDRRVFTSPDGSQIECTYARDFDKREWKTYRECTDQVAPLPIPSLDSVLATIGLDALTTTVVTALSRGLVRFGRSRFGTPELPPAAPEAPAPEAPVPPVPPVPRTAAMPPIEAEVARLRALENVGDYVRHYDTPQGRVRFNAMYVTDQLPDGGRRLALANIDIMAAEGSSVPGERRITGVYRELNEAMAQLLVEAKAAGYAQVYVTGTRAAWSSSANPGKEYRWIADLTVDTPTWRPLRPGDDP
jgi:hypothetical protein